MCVIMNKIYVPVTLPHTSAIPGLGDAIALLPIPGLGVAPPPGWTWFQGCRPPVPEPACPRGRGERTTGRMGRCGGEESRLSQTLGNRSRPPFPDCHSPSLPPVNTTAVRQACEWAGHKGRTSKPLMESRTQYLCPSRVVMLV